MEKPEKKMVGGPESSDNSDRRRRRRPGRLSPSDRLTALPEHILHQILKLLPYRSAVATSVLSSHWRHLWKHRWPEPSCLHLAHSDDFVADVNRQIELHPPPRSLDAVTIRPVFVFSRITTLRVVDCRNIYNIDPSVTRFRSLYLRGLRLDSMPVVFSALEDVCMSWTWSSGRLNTQPSWGNMNPTTAFANVHFLTVGGVPFQNFAFALHTPLALGSLRELQILMAGMSADQFGTIYKFFENVLCTSLERLFIELPSTASGPRMKSLSQMEEEEHPPLEGISFENLRIIKMKNFRGVSMEIDLVKFFLMKAIGLESMIIVAADVAEKVSTCQKHNQADEPTVIRQQLELLPKASTNTKLKFCQSDVDLAQPRHREFQNGSCGCNSSC